MEYRRLGRAGVKVSSLCLGTGFRAQRDETTCLRVIERALDLGCNFIDSANYYGQGRSEEILAKALKGKRDDVVLTSKVCSPVGDGPNDRGLSRYHILREVERSLRRLQTDHLDIYLLHLYDPDTPLEETLSAMNDLVRQGKTRYVGICNFTAAQTYHALWVADTIGLDTIATLQLQYNLLHRQTMEEEIMPLLREQRLGLMTYSPLAIGLLTGRYRVGEPAPPGSPWTDPKRLAHALSEQTQRVLDKLTEIGQAHGKTPAQVAIAWLLDHPEVTAVILGPDEPEHVDEAFGGAGWQLTREERAALDAVSMPPKVWRYDGEP